MHRNKSFQVAMCAFNKGYKTQNFCLVAATTVAACAKINVQKLMAELII